MLMLNGYNSSGECWRCNICLRYHTYVRTFDEIILDTIQFPYDGYILPGDGLSLQCSDPSIAKPIFRMLYIDIYLE